MQESQLKGEEGSQERRSRRKLKISIPKWCGKWVVSMDEYKDGVVGAKSKNLAGAHLPALFLCMAHGGGGLCGH